MMDLLWNAINHIPEHIIRDRTRIWNDNDGFQYVLAFEDWEFRVYNYEFLDEFTRDDYPDVFRQADEYFYNFDWYVNIDTLAYTRLDIDTDTDIREMVNEIVNWVVIYLDAEETPIDLRTKISTFITTRLTELGTKVYQYYK